MALPTPVFATAPEPFDTYYGESECDPWAEREGVAAFREFVLRHQGGGMGHVGRPCGATGARSGHYSGRAWDWMIDALDPEQKARADELIAWLLEGDAEMFRRAGLIYLIWDKRRWSPGKGWQPYDGWGSDGTCTQKACRHPHQDHVHFSFGKAGADGQTSLYDWLADPAHPKPPIDAPPTPNPYAPVGGARGAFAAGLGLGVGAVVAAHWALDRFRK